METTSILPFSWTYYITAVTAVYTAEQFVLQETFLSLKIRDWVNFIFSILNLATAHTVYLCQKVEKIELILRPRRSHSSKKNITIDKRCELHIEKHLKNLKLIFYELCTTVNI